MDLPAKVKFEIRGNIGFLTLDHPPANELASPEFVTASQLQEWSEIPGVNGLIISGTGRNFSSGANLEELFKMAHDRDFTLSKMEAGKKTLETLSSLNIPVMAAIQGVCFGGGLEIAMACHIRVCSVNSLFAFPEVNQQLMPGLGGSVRLGEIVGHGRALDILLSGDTLSAEEAMDLKLADHCRPKGQVMDFAVNLMTKMVDGKPKKVVNAIMQSWHNSKKMDFRQAMREETRLFYELASDELKRRKSSAEQPL